MSFNVTQCPACESTFNTNSRVLAAAAGRVRCGACLNVFEAIDNFLIPEADEDQDRDESVFVGNDPQEFFDPSSFLTRSALRETHSNDADRTNPIDEQNLHQALEQSETVSEDFFATVAEELQGRVGAPALENKPEIEEADEEKEEIRQTEQPKSLQTNIATESIDVEFEEDILGSFAAQATEAKEFTENYIAKPPFDEPIEPALEPALTEAADPHIENKQSFLGPGLSASFSFDPNAYRRADSNEARSDTPLERETETASEQPIIETSASNTETQTDADSEELPLYTAAAEALEHDAPTSSDTEWPPQDDEVFDPPAHDQASQALSAEAAAGEPLPTAESSATPEQLADTAADIENKGIDSESPSDETYTTHALAEPEELASESAAAEEERAIEAPQTNAAEVDEESTEAIRARALEAELSDEEALEAIPRENLAALGLMSAPVEFFARKESRLLRSTLLFLSIVLLGGLLSSQYLWQRMELYSQLPQLRPLYETACSYLDCTLPDYADIDSIRSENLTVQTHPTLANGLMVNTVIRNTAAFEQPFPILILSFNSAQNNVIALREFTSAEYLDPGLNSIQVMPAMTPVQIGLAIMDPGSEAVNYTLAFRWP